MKIFKILNKAFCEQFKREVGIDLKLKDDTIVLKGKKVKLNSKLKEELREELYEAIHDNIFLNNKVNH